MVLRFLLHDSSDMRIGGVSGERKLSIWGSVLEWHRRRQEVLCPLKSLLSGGGPLQSLGSSPQKISQRFQDLSTVGQKTAVKVYYAKKLLQSFDILRQPVSISVAWLAVGAAPFAEILCPRISREGAHFSRLMARLLVAKALKKASRWWRCVCLSREPTRELSMYANTPSRPSVVRSIILWKVCAALESPKGVKRQSNKPNGVMIAAFEMSSVATGIW